MCSAKWAWFVTAQGPQSFSIDGRKIVLWHHRLGEIVAMDDTCVLCGAHLSCGRVEIGTVARGDGWIMTRPCIQCVGDHAAFDRDGRMAGLIDHGDAVRSQTVWNMPVQRTHDARMGAVDMTLVFGPNVAQDYFPNDSADDRNQHEQEGRRDCHGVHDQNRPDGVRS